MKNIRNKRGFTLVEIIATVVILGILLTTAVVGYSKYIESSKKNYYTTQEKLITQAGRDFFNDNRGYLPTMVGEENCVTLKTLITNKYIEEVKDYNKNNCDKEKTKVCAQKISLTKYNYDTLLICDKDETSATIYSEPSVSFKLKNGNSFGESETLTGTSNKSYEIVLNVQDEYGIDSYQYRIYKNNKVYKTNSVSVTNKDKNISATISLPDESGTFYIETKVYNLKGKSSTEISGKITQTFSKGSCTSLITFKNGTTKWTNSNIDVKIQASSDVKYYYLDVIDADTDVKIGDSILVGTDIDGNVGQNISNYTYTISANNNTLKRVYLKVTPYNQNNKNYSACNTKSNIYKIDKVVPTVEITAVEGTQPTVKLKCKDNVKIVSYYFGTKSSPTSSEYVISNGDLKNLQADGLNKTVNDSGTYYLICKDNAGNTVSGNIDVNSESTYIVNHYVHDLGTNTYTLNSTDTLTGNTGSTITVANLKKTIAGFTYVDGYLTGNTTKPTSGAVTTTTVLGDGSRVINLYYRRNYLYVRYHVNGGEMAEQHGSAYGVTNSFVTSTSNTTANKFWVGVYGSKVNTVSNSNTYAQGTAGLINYNNSSSVNIVKAGYIGKSGAQWNTKADGSGTSYNQATATYDANNFGGVDLSTGDKTVTLYVNWVINPNIPYVVNHYVHDLGSNTYTLDSTDNLKGVANENVNVNDLKKTIAGFTFVDGYTTGDNTKPTSGSITTTTILADGSRVINLYYRRNNLYVQYNINGGSLTNNIFEESNGLISYNGKTKFLRGVYGSKVGLVDTSTYSVGTEGLLDYDTELFITKQGYKGKIGEEWNTASAGTGTSYNQATSTYNANGFAGKDLSTGDKTVTLYVNWTPITNVVSFDADGGTGGQSEDVVATYDQAMPEISTTAPTKKYRITFTKNDDSVYDNTRHSNGATMSKTYVDSALTFNGWYASNGTRFYTAAGASARNWNRTTDTTLYANWSEYGAEVNTPTITKPGYDCGWTTSSTGTTIEVKSGEAITPDSSKTYYGICIEKYYTLYVDGNGGDLKVSSSNSYPQVTYKPFYSELKIIPTPTRANYTFNKWAYFEELIKKPTNGTYTNDASFSSTFAGVMPYDNKGSEIAYTPNETNPTSIRKHIVTITRYANSHYGSGSQWASPIGNYVLNINNGSTSSASPGMGGFSQAIYPTANHRYVHVIVATVPKGVYLHYGSNAPLSSTGWLTPNEGKGDWRVYIYELTPTSTSSLGYVYFSKSANSDGSSESSSYFFANIAYSAILDITNTWWGIGQLDGSGELKATWTPNVYEVTLDNQNATAAGTTKIFEKYGVGYYRNYSNGTVSGPMQKEGSTAATGITKPQKTGYTFQGYYTGTGGTGKQVIDSGGNLVTGASIRYTEFTKDGSLYAYWVKNNTTPTSWSCYCAYTVNTYYCPIVASSWSLFNQGEGFNWTNTVYVTDGCRSTSSGQFWGLDGGGYCHKDTRISSVKMHSAYSCNNALASGTTGAGWELFYNGSVYSCKCNNPTTYYLSTTYTTSSATFTTKPTNCSYWGKSGSVYCS